VVASDGTATSRGALTVAGCLAHRDRAAIEIVSALSLAPTSAASLPPLETAEHAAERLDRVVAQATRILGGGGRWTASIVEGSLGAAVERATTLGRCDLLIVESAPPRNARALGLSTALVLAQRVAVPVLAVPPSVTSLPRRAVVGLDDRPAARMAASAVSGILEAPATVHLVHVSHGRAGGLVRPIQAHRQTVGDHARLARTLQRSLAEPGRVDVEHVVIQGGDPATRLLAHASAVGADVIAVGSRQAEDQRLWPCGDGVRLILHAASCCVLLSGRVSPEYPEPDTFDLGRAG
jgi:nucleotide-binding universal stress UspA family protein